MEDTSAEPPQWCVVANVREAIYYGPNRDWVQTGTRHFSAGTKVYVRGVKWDAEFTKLSVVGKHRGTSRLTTMIIRPSWLTHWRAQLIYSPRALRKIRERGFPGPTSAFPTDASEDSKAKAEHLAKVFQDVFPPLPEGSSTENIT